jgi:hypothetical protein
MSELRLSYPASVIAGKHRIVPDDILLLRLHMFPNGLTSPFDANQLLAIHKSCPEKCPDWENWFVETMTAYIVFHSWPQHSLDDINVDWMIGMFSHDGIIETTTELELVLHVIEVSRAVPEGLTVFALKQLHHALLNDNGAYSVMRANKRRGLGCGDINYLYRILRGACYDGKMVLAAREIAVLEEIGQTVAEDINHPAWRHLMRSIAKRDADGHADPRPWLRMLQDDLFDLNDAA